ncbi:MAG: glycosyltransferase family 39 protein [Methylococcales bacterium]|nr:glycosyltransferase family 39 protein [Methylococcales bacterium]
MLTELKTKKLMPNKTIQFINNHLILVLASLFFIRTTYLFVNGLDLIGDETYYWDWSRQLDWCYYSKPPMIAWLMRLSTELGGHTTAIVRLPSVFLGTLFLAYFYATTKAIYNAQAAALALLILLATPINLIANFIMTIDAPLYCFWMMSLYYLHKALFNNSLHSWLWAGIATGLALLSKQAALLLPVMLAAYLLSDKQRQHLFKREFLLYLLPIIICAIPIILWNQQHDWVMFGHSKGHFVTEEKLTLLKRLEQGATFLLYQLLLITPVVTALLLINSFKYCLKLKQLPEQDQFLVWMGPILLLGIIALGFIQKVQGNWSMPFYFSGIILLSGQWQKGQWQKSLKYGLMLGYFMVTLTYALPVLIQAFNLQNTPVDPTFRFRHTQELISSIDAERKKVTPTEKPAFFLTLGHRYLASQLAFYLPDHPQVFRYEPTGEVVSQYEVWGGPVDYIGKSAYFVTELNEKAIPAELKAIFSSFRKVGEVVNPSNKNSVYSLYIAENLKAWPPKI